SRKDALLAARPARAAAPERPARAPAAAATRLRSVPSRARPPEMSRRGARRPPRRSPPLCCPFRSRPGANLAPRSDFQPLERRPRIDDVALELELGLFQSCGDAHELGEVEDRQLEGASGGGLELLLPRIERQMAEGAGSHHHVRTGLERLLDGLDELAHRRLLARLDDREPAALDLRGIVD